MNNRPGTPPIGEFPPPVQAQPITLALDRPTKDFLKTWQPQDELDWIHALAQNPLIGGPPPVNPHPHVPL
jgi:hypothetical protein